MNRNDVPDKVIHQARQLADIEAMVVADPTGVAIVHDGKNFRFFNVSAWTKPEEQSFFPWPGPPQWPAICVVRVDGSIADP